MAEREYSEDEVAEIFERATKAQRVTRRQVSDGAGMTLSELHEIGREVGISSEDITQAAHSLDRPERATSRRFLGFPIGVGRTVEFTRELSDLEWDRLVVDLRETFDARGRVRSEGSLRQWTNGNLQALLEPTPTGHRLRLRTTKGNARGMMSVGLGMTIAGFFSFVTTMLAGGSIDTGALGSFVPLAVTGLGLFGIGASRLSSWSQLRARQMEGIAARWTRITSASPVPELPADS